MIRKIINFFPFKMKRHQMLRLINIYPPLLGAGIRATRIDPDLSTIEVEMKLTRLNRNYVGSHFGGSLYSMCDPFFMIILMEKLGPTYLVWDKTATIHFKKPGRTTVRARFHVEEAELNHIREQTKGGKKFEPKFVVSVIDGEGEEVAVVEKTLWVKLKKERAPV